MSDKEVLIKINSILKLLDKESNLSLLRELQLLEGYLLAESIDKKKISIKKISMKEIVDEVKKTRRKIHSHKI